MKKKTSILIIGLIGIIISLGIFWIVKNNLLARPDYSVKLEIDPNLSEKTENGPFRFTEGGYEFLDVALLKPAERDNNIYFWDKGNFSRCSTGAFYHLFSIPKERDPYFKGKVMVEKECDTLSSFDFRINPTGNIVEILDEKTQKYISPREFFTK